eukprot:gnl/Spiro4/5464_TR2769_c1_g1_i1.p3 gnl/Spiro4/5464_TR2769_c1_g1~~gnl/Spiro4/5464_TR2769_c1_g1_i1.p3  ORF type:complete len:298 (-),score=73.03 gnl/Spiro4/5464_TR2769_c1_g1_i1:8329-9222(-)
MARIKHTPTTPTTQTQRPQKGRETSAPINEDYKDKDPFDTDAKLVYMGIKNYMRSPRNFSSMLGGRVMTKLAADQEPGSEFYSTHIPWHELDIHPDLQEKYKGVKLFVGAPSVVGKGMIKGFVTSEVAQRRGGSLLSKHFPGTDTNNLEYHLNLFRSMHPSSDHLTLASRHADVMKQLNAPETFETHLHEFTHVNQYLTKRSHGTSYGLDDKAYFNHPLEKEAFTNEIEHRLKRVVPDMSPHENVFSKLNSTQLRFLKNVDANHKKGMMERIYALKQKHYPGFDGSSTSPNKKESGK